MLARAVRRRRDQYAVRAVAATVVFALAACQPVASSATPVPSAIAVTPAPSASAARVLDDRFGFIVSDGHGTATVRSETSDVAITTFMTQGRSWTSLSHEVSPDGRSIAYWASVNDGAVLHVRSTTGADRVVFTAAKEMAGNTFAWSSDGVALAIMIDNNCQEICAVQGGHPVQELWTVDVATGASERVASGSYWLPVAWDRAAKLIAAGVTGPGGYLIGYDVIDLSKRPAVVRSSPFPFGTAGRLKASTDARFVLLAVGLATATTLSWWPIDAPQKRAEIRVFDGMTAEWRPATSEIWWSGPGGLRAMDVLAGTQTSLRGSFGEVIGFRIDGSAVMTSQPSLNGVLVIDVMTASGAQLPIGGPFVRIR